MLRQARGPAGEGADMQELRHPRAVIDRIVVPKKRLAPQLPGHARQMPWRIFPGADFLARPEHFDGGIQQAAEVLQIVFGTLAEEAVKHWIVGVVAGTNDQACRLGARLNPMQDVGLGLREMGKIAAHVVEEDGEIVESPGIERGQFARQIGLRLRIEVAVELKGAKPHTEAHAQRAAAARQHAQRGRSLRRMIFAPALAQECICLWRIDVEIVAKWLQRCDGALALGPAPWPAVIAFDQTQLDRHAVLLKKLRASSVR